MLSRTRWSALGAVLMVLSLSLCTTASAAKNDPRFVRIAGFKSPGTPSKYNKVGILQTGSPKARTSSC